MEWVFRSPKTTSVGPHAYLATEIINNCDAGLRLGGQLWRRAQPEFQLTMTLWRRAAFGNPMALNFVARPCCFQDGNRGAGLRLEWQMRRRAAFANGMALNFVPPPSCVRRPWVGNAWPICGAGLRLGWQLWRRAAFGMAKLLPLNLVQWLYRDVFRMAAIVAPYCVRDGWAKPF